MVYPVDSGGTAPVYIPPAPQNHNPDPSQAAREVLDTGKRPIIVDDYEARMKELAHQLSLGDPTYREQLMAEILKRDPNALNSWLTPERANNLRSQGQITLDQEGQIADAFAAAYNAGAMPSYSRGITSGPGQINGVTNIDNVIASYEGTGGFDKVQSAQRVREFLDFLDTSNSGEVAAFRQEYAQHLLDQYVLNKDVALQSPNQRDAAAGLAADLLSADANHPEFVVNLLMHGKPGGTAYSAQDIQTFMQAASRSNGLYGEDVLKVPAQDQMKNARDISVPNGSALLMDMVSLAQGPDADALALQIAQMAKTSPDIFDKSRSGYQENVDSLTLLTNNHAKYILDQLTTKNNDYTGSASDPNSQQYISNGQQLAALFKTAMFNPDANYRQMLQSTVTRYTSDLKDQVMNKTDPVANGVHTKASTRLAMLFASLDEGVRLGYTQIAANDKAKKELWGMALDIVLAGIPATKWAEGPVKQWIESSFQGNSRVQDVLNGSFNKLIETPYGKLTDGAKSDLINALVQSGDDKNQAAYKVFINGLRDSVTAQLPDDNINGLYLSTAPDDIFQALQKADGG
jgi:hypothetical protein